MTMRHLLRIFPLLLLTTAMQAMDVPEAQQMVSRAQQAYADGDHEKALELFDSVNTVYTSAGLLYNIGNCHFKSQNIPRAILYYERALKLRPGAEDVQANLELARQMIADRVNEMPGRSIGTIILGALGGEKADHPAWVAVIAWCLTLLLAAWALLLRRTNMKRVLFAVAGISLIITIAAIGMAAVRKNSILDRSDAIIMAPRIDVKSEPRTAGTTLLVLHKGTKVGILQSLEDWHEVVLGNGAVGWIPAGTFERI